MSRRVILSKIDPASLAKTMAVFYGVLGLVVCGLMLPLALLKDDGTNLMLILLMLILYPVMGFVGSWFSATVLNAVARRWGGIEFEVDDMT
jgi:hypothetical protein